MPAGPRNLLVNDAVYEYPVAGWAPSWPAAFRKRIFLYSVLFSIAALALASLRNRLVPFFLVSLALLSVGGLSWWWRYQTPVQQRTGEIVVHDAHLTQHDNWLLQLSAGATSARTLFAPSLHPIFAPGSINPASPFHLTLTCGEKGDPISFDYQLPPNIPMAFLSRTISAEPLATINVPITPSTESRLINLARADYVTQQASITGQSAAPTQTWPTINITRTPNPEPEPRTLNPAPRTLNPEP